MMASKSTDCMGQMDLIIYIYLYPLVMTNIAMENDGPNRNRWFTVLNSMVNFHGELLYTMINNHQ